MNYRKLFLDFVGNKPVKQTLFYPDITDWYKTRRLPRSIASTVPTGSFIPDDAPYHSNDHGIPSEYRDWTFLDFYRRFEWGLPVHIYDWCSFEYHHCEFKQENEGNSIIKSFRTPMGEITRVDGMAADGSLCAIKHFVETKQDWKVLMYVISNTAVVANYEYIEKTLDGIGEMGVADLVLWRSPFGKILEEYVGLTTVAMQLQDDPEIVYDCMDVQEKLDLQVVQLAADSPADIVILSDHADQALISPPWYQQYLLPFYLKTSSILHQKHKIFSTHLDGNFKALFDPVKKSGVDLLDGCTPAPMTNYEVEELANALAPQMKAYCGVPSIYFCDNTPVEKIIEFADRIITNLKGKVVLNIGDILPSDGDINKLIELGKWIKAINSKQAQGV